MILLLSISAKLVNASPIGFNISGKITKTSTNTVVTGVVDFRIRVLSPNGCELYSEEHLNKDLSLTGGVYSFVLGLGTSPTNVYSPGSPQAKASLVQVFSNTAPTVNSLVGPAASDCLSGSYAPADGDIRRIRLEFDPGTGWTYLNPYHEIRSVPFSYHAENSSNADKLGGVLASQYIKSTDLATTIPGVETDPNVQAFAKTALPTCAAGQVLRSNGTTLSCIADANGGAPPLATTTSTGVIQVGTGLLVDGSGILSVDDLAMSKITGLSAALDGKLSLSALPSCTADKTMAWNSVTDTMSCLDISITAADVSDFNTAVDARITAADTGSPKLPLAGGTMTGAINLDGNNLLNTGDITMSATKSLKVGEFSQVQENALALVAGHRGTTWYNYDLNALRFWDGTAKQRIVSSSASCANGEVLKWNTDHWECSADVGATGANAVQIQGVDVAGTANTTGQILRFNSVSGDWEVSTIQAADLPSNIARNKLATGTANYVVIHDGSGNLSEEAQLAVSRGGTGQGSYTDGQLLIGKTDGTLAKANITAGSGINITNGDGTITIAAAVSGIGNSASLSNGTFWIGDGSGVAQEATMSGDATISNSGVLTLKNTGTAGTSGTAQAVPRITTDAQGRITGVTEVTIDDNTKLPLAGGTMSGAINMGGQNITATGDISMGSQKSIKVGNFSQAQEDGMALAAGDLGTLWYNSDLSALRFWDGTAKQRIISSSGACANGQVLKWNTDHWECSADVGASGANAVQIQGVDISASAPTTTGQILRFNSVSGDWEVAMIQAADLPSNITRNKLATGTANYVVIHDGSGNLSEEAQLAVNRGGTGQSTYTDGQLLIGKNDGTLAKSTLTAGSGVTITNGDGTVTIAANTPSVGNSVALSTGTFWVGDGSNVAQEATMSGDATISTTGVLTLKNTGTAGTSGTAQAVPRITTDAQGRITGVTEVTIDDDTKLPLAGGTMSGAINMGAQDITAAGNIVMGANKYLTLSANGTNGTAAGQIWFDAGKIKYYDGSDTKELGVVGVGITSLNGSSATSHSFVAPTNAGTTLGWTTNAGTGAHTLNIPLAATNGVTAGLISNTDYDNFSDKISQTLSNGSILVGNGSNVATAVSVSGDATLANTGALTIANSAITDAKVSASAAIARSKLAAGTANHVLINDGSGVMSSTASLPVSLGGTGATSFTTGSFLQYNGTSLASFTCSAGEHPVWTVSGWICGKDFYSTGSTSSANYVRATGGAATVAPIIDVAGSDTNITLKIQAKGTGSVQTESPLNLNNIYVERSPAEANSGASVTIPETTNIARYVLTANTTITLPSTPSTGATVFSLTVKIKQDGTGNRTLAWNPGAGNSIKWDGGAAAEPAAAAGEESIYQFVRFGDEAVWYASQVWKEQ